MTIKSAYSIRGENQKPAKPSLQFTNNTKATQFLNGMELTFDPYFSLYGVTEIYVDGKKILDQNEVNTFRQLGLFTIPINSKPIRPYGSIDIFIWNPKTEDRVFLTASIDMDDTAHPSTLSGQAVNNALILKQIGGGAGDEYDTHEIFPYQIYRDTRKEFLINTRGRSNMLLTMGTTNITQPSEIPHTFSPSLPELQITLTPTTTSRKTTSDVKQITYPFFRKYRFQSWITPSKGFDYEGYNVSVSHPRQNILINGSPSYKIQPPLQYTDSHILLDCINGKNKNIKFYLRAGKTPLTILTSKPIITPIQTITTHLRKRGWTREPTKFSRRTGKHNDRKVDGAWGKYNIYSITRFYTSTSITLTSRAKAIAEVSNDRTFTRKREIPDIKHGYNTLSFDERYLRLRQVYEFGSTRLNSTTISKNEQILTPVEDYGFDPLSRFINTMSGHTRNSGTANIDINKTIILKKPKIKKTIAVSNVTDLTTHGGTAKVFFELRGVNNEWFKILSAEQLGAITAGDSKIIQYDISGIPPTQDRFRAVLEVKGTVQTGVTIDLTA